MRIHLIKRTGIPLRSTASEECCYYDVRSGLCGFCMKRIVREVEEKLNGDGQDDDKGTE